MLSATKAYLCAAFMKWGGLSSTDDSPSWFGEIQKERNPSVKWDKLQIRLGKFVDEFVLTEFDIEKRWREQLDQRAQQQESQRDEQSARLDDSGGQIISSDKAPSRNAQDARIPGMKEEM